METEAPFRRRGSSKQKLGETVLEDLSRGDFGSTMHQDLQEIYQFYLDKETREELDEMGEERRWLYLVYWLVRSSILRLPPSRRLLLLGSMFLFVFGVLGNFPWLIAAFMLVLLILILELKDKLLAQDELATGRAVQRALLPREHPEMPGWETWLFTRPANEVGGDLVDYLMVDDHRLGLALGDVAGKGLGAALVMAKLQSTLRAIAPDFEVLDALAAKINEIFCRDGLPNRFVSMVYVELDAGTGQARFFNAGHLPPVVLGREGIQKTTKGGPALGLTPEACYQEQSVVLAPGELLLVYSDGLTEARNEDGAFFDDRRLEVLLPKLRGLTAEAAGRRLLAEVNRFTGEARPSDDLSMILIRRKAPSSSPTRRTTEKQTSLSA